MNRFGAKHSNQVFLGKQAGCYQPSLHRVHSFDQLHQVVLFIQTQVDFVVDKADKKNCELSANIQTPKPKQSKFEFFLLQKYAAIPPNFCGRIL